MSVNNIEWGSAFFCKHVEASEDEWFQCGCEVWHPSYCGKFQRDWKKTFQNILNKFKK